MVKSLCLRAEFLCYDSQYLRAAFYVLKIGPLNYSVRAFSTWAKNDDGDAGGGEESRIHPSCLADLCGHVSKYRGCLTVYDLYNWFLKGDFERIANQAGLHDCFEGWVGCCYLLENPRYSVSTFCNVSPGTVRLSMLKKQCLG